MGIDLRGVQVVMSQNLLDGPHIHAVLQHQRCSGVAQLMGRILCTVDPGGTQALFDHGMYCRAADPFVSGRKKQRVGIPSGDGPPNRQIILQSLLAGIVQIQDPNLIALTKNAQRILAHIV